MHRFSHADTTPSEGQLRLSEASEPWLRTVANFALVRTKTCQAKNWPHKVEICRSEGMRASITSPVFGRSRERNQHESTRWLRLTPP